MVNRSPLPAILAGACLEYWRKIEPPLRHSGHGPDSEEQEDSDEVFHGPCSLALIY
jgi:hypothetical protein